jgi:hypothetical protein
MVGSKVYNFPLRIRRKGNDNGEVNSHLCSRKTSQSNARPRPQLGGAFVVLVA